jgi:hypothetical protein
VRIAAFRCDAPARLSAFADGRVVAGDAGAFIATLRCDAAARCGAFADGRRIVPGDEGAAACGAKRSSSPAGWCVLPGVIADRPEPTQIAGAHLLVPYKTTVARS